MCSGCLTQSVLESLDIEDEIRGYRFPIDDLSPLEKVSLIGLWKRERPADRESALRLLERWLHEQQLVQSHRALAEYLARKFVGPGEPLEDLVQVASIGLHKAAARFDPARDVTFSIYATPIIAGELERHFRDKV